MDFVPVVCACFYLCTAFGCHYLEYAKQTPSQHFYIVTGLVALRSLSDFYSSPRAACCGNHMRLSFVFHREAEKKELEAGYLGLLETGRPLKISRKPENSSETEKTAEHHD